jgi:hypothetical protein
MVQDSNRGKQGDPELTGCPLCDGHLEGFSFTLREYLKVS